MRSVVNSVKSNVKGHSPTYLAAGGCVGVLTTAYFAARAGHKSASNWKGDLKAYVRSSYREYIPVGISAALTIGCVVGGNRLGLRRTVAAQVLLAASERAYSAYRDEVIEELGSKKDSEIRDRVAQRRVEDNPPPAVMIAGTGDILAMEMHTGRYFSTTMEKLRKAQNEVNRKLLIEDYQALDDFYYEIGLPVTQSSSEVGWRSPKLMDLEFSSTIHEDRPVLVFGYNYLEHL